MWNLLPSYFALVPRAPNWANWKSGASPSASRRVVALVSVETQTEIQNAQVEVQTTRPQTTLVSVETQTIEVREAQTAKTKGEIQDEMEDRKQRGQKSRFLQSIPGIICAEQPERLRNRHTSCCLFVKHPPGDIIRLWELISPFLTKKYKESRRIWETI